jgi:alpha,alpha-trehalase
MKEQLSENGTGLGVKSLSEPNPANSNSFEDCFPGMPEFPSVVDKLKGMKKEQIREKIVFFLDGALAPITSQSTGAHPALRELVKQLASFCKVVLVSGQDPVDPVGRAGLEGLIQAGNHGFDIRLDNGRTMQHPGAAAYLPHLLKAWQALHRLLEGVEGARIEPRKYAIAVHYRHVSPEKVEQVLEAVYRAGQSSGRLKIRIGEKVLELHPAMVWDRGKAVAWIMEAMQLNPATVVPIYLGDDGSEEAFRSIKDTGIGILVGGYREHTSAVYRLKDMAEVGQLLQITNMFLKQ